MRTSINREAVVANLLRTKGPPRSTAKPTGSFNSLGEQLRKIALAAQGRGTDHRLVRAPFGLGETDPSGGGFAVGEQFAEKLIEPLYLENPVAARCDRWPTSYPLGSIKIPGIDESSRADGSRWGGALAYWSAEGDSVSPSFPRFRLLEFSPKKLIAVINGSAEAVATIVASNIEKMWSRLPAPSRRTATWLIHEDVTPQLDQLQGGVGEGSMYLPAGAFGNEFALLKGRPVFEIEQAPVLGSVGDIILADLGKYIVVDGGQTPALSVDVRFLTDEVVRRFTWRVDGRTAFVTPISPFHGSNARSPYVTLAAR
jgi:Phage capsid family